MSDVPYLSTNNDKGSRQNIGGKKQRDQRRKTHSLSLYPKIFDYSLGGYYHRGAERAPDDIIKVKLQSDKMKVGIMSLSLYSK
jgi:hypothetical protein